MDNGSYQLEPDMAADMVMGHFPSLSDCLDYFDQEISAGMMLDGQTDQQNLPSADPITVNPQDLTLDGQAGQQNLPSADSITVNPQDLMLDGQADQQNLPSADPITVNPQDLTMPQVDSTSTSAPAWEWALETGVSNDGPNHAGASLYPQGGHSTTTSAAHPITSQTWTGEGFSEPQLSLEDIMTAGNINEWQGGVTQNQHQSFYATRLTPPDVASPVAATTVASFSTSSMLTTEDLELGILTPPYDTTFIDNAAGPQATSSQNGGPAAGGYPMMPSTQGVPYSAAGGQAFLDFASFSLNGASHATLGAQHSSSNFGLSRHHDNLGVDAASHGAHPAASDPAARKVGGNTVHSCARARALASSSRPSAVNRMAQVIRTSRPLTPEELSLPVSLSGTGALPKQKKAGRPRGSQTKKWALDGEGNPTVQILSQNQFTAGAAFRSAPEPTAKKGRPRKDRGNRVG